MLQRRSNLALLTALFMLLTLVFPAAAQDSTITAPINYCAGTLSYDLPNGWVASALKQTQYGTSLRIANSDSALNSQTLSGGDAVINLNVIGRSYIASALRLEADAVPTTILAVVGAQAAQGFTVDTPKQITLAGQPAARLDARSAAITMTMLAVDLGGDAVGMLALSTPTGAAAQDATALDFAGSLTFDAPRFSLPDDNSLTQFYASSDCTVSFAYPADWNVLNVSEVSGQFYQIQVRNFDGSKSGSSSAYMRAAGEAQLQIGVIMPPPADDSTSLEATVDQIAQQPGYEIVSKDETTIAGQPALVIQMHVDDPAQGVAGESLQISIQYGDQAIVALALYTAPGELDQWRDTALAIAELADAGGAADVIRRIAL